MAHIFWSPFKSTNYAPCCLFTRSRSSSGSGRIRAPDTVQILLDTGDLRLHVAIQATLAVSPAAVTVPTIFCKVDTICESVVTDAAIGDRTAKRLHV